MDCETNFYHCTLQVKKGSWECVIYAGFDFYVASMASSIIALLGTFVHWAPDEMLSWHRYQSPYACPSLVPDVHEGACVVAAGLPPRERTLPPSTSPAPLWQWRQCSQPFVIWMALLEHVFWMWGLHLCMTSEGLPHSLGAVDLLLMTQDRGNICAGKSVPHNNNTNQETTIRYFWPGRTLGSSTRTSGLDTLSVMGCEHFVLLCCIVSIYRAIGISL